MELVEAQITFLGGEKVESVGSEFQEASFHGYFDSLIDGHVSGIPQFDGVFVSPLSEVISLKLTFGAFFEGFWFIGDEGVVVLVGGDVGDDLSGLIFDDDCLWWFILFFVER